MVSARALALFTLLLCGANGIHAKTIGERVSESYNTIRTTLAGHKDEDTLSARIEVARACCKDCFNKHLADQLPDVSGASADAWNAMKAKLSTNWQSTQDAAASAQNDVKQTTEQTTDSVKKAASQTADKAAEAHDHYTTLFGGYWDYVKDYILKAQDSARSAAQSTINVGKDTAAAAQDSLNSAASSAEKTATSAGKQAKATANAAYDNTKAASESAVKKANQAASDTAKAVHGAAATAADETHHAAEAADHSVRHGVKNVVNKVLHGTEEAAATTRDSAEGTRKKAAQAEL